MSIKQETVREILDEGIANYKALEQLRLSIVKAARAAFISGDYRHAVDEILALTDRPIPDYNKMLAWDKYYQRFSHGNLRRRLKRQEGYSRDNPAPQLAYNQNNPAPQTQTEDDRIVAEQNRLLREAGML